ncbi:MAG TPA: hypothetical protein VIY51_14100 [Xanthobacteraceae bacterium]
MMYRAAADLAGTAYADNRPKVFLPHLVCSWTLDPASQRLSCAWAAPVQGWDVTFSRIASTRLSPRTAFAK